MWYQSDTVFQCRFDSRREHLERKHRLSRVKSGSLNSCPRTQHNNPRGQTQNNWSRVPRVLASHKSNKVLSHRSLIWEKKEISQTCSRWEKSSKRTWAFLSLPKYVFTNSVSKLNFILLKKVVFLMTFSNSSAKKYNNTMKSSLICSVRILHVPLKPHGPSRRPLKVSSAEKEGSSFSKSFEGGRKLNTVVESRGVILSYTNV